MKKFLWLFLAGVLLFTGAGAQKHKSIDVPAAVKTAFAQQFPGTPAEWVKEGSQYEAHFKQKRQAIIAVYHADGTLAETEAELKVGQLPLPVRDYMTQHFRGSTIVEAAKITKANGSINYKACVKGKDMLFDASCVLLTEQGQPVTKF